MLKALSAIVKTEKWNENDLNILLVELEEDLCRRKFSELHEGYRNTPLYWHLILDYWYSVVTLPSRTLRREIHLLRKLSPTKEWHCVTFHKTVIQELTLMGTSNLKHAEA
jgi:hypothetical protein